MKLLTGEIFRLRGGRTMLVHNEQETRMRMGEHLVYDGNIYCLAGVDPPGKPTAKWAIQIKEILPDDPFYGFKICKCFSPPDARFLKGDAYRWTWCIDGMIAYDDSGNQWSADEIEFYQHFLLLNGK